MRRVPTANAIVLVGALLLLVLAPVLPADHSYNSETDCPQADQLCSTGNNVLRLHGYGSVSYALAGVGGWWQASMGYSLFSSQSSRQLSAFSPSTSTRGISVPSPSATILNPHTGLRLGLNLSLAPNGVNVAVNEYNTLDTVNNVTAADPPLYPAAVVDAYSECAGEFPNPDGWASELGGPAIFAVFQGNFDSSNYTAGRPLTLYNATHALPYCVGLRVGQYSFQPLSTQAGAYYYYEPSPKPMFNINRVSFAFEGYWTGSVFQQLSPGIYTVVAMDEWGQVAILQFSVQN